MDKCGGLAFFKAFVFLSFISVPFMLLSGCGSVSSGSSSATYGATSIPSGPTSALFSVLSPNQGGGNPALNGAPYTGNISLNGACDLGTQIEVQWENDLIYVPCSNNSWSAVMIPSPYVGSLSITVTERDPSTQNSLKSITRQVNLSVTSSWKFSVAFGASSFTSSLSMNGACDIGNTVLVTTTATSVNVVQNQLVPCVNGFWQTTLSFDPSPDGTTDAQRTIITVIEQTSAHAPLAGVNPVVRTFDF